MAKKSSIKTLTLADYLERIPAYAEGRVVSIPADVRDEIADELRRYEALVKYVEELESGVKKDE